VGRRGRDHSRNQFDRRSKAPCALPDERMRLSGGRETRMIVPSARNLHERSLT
jgi:hypothetical protein